MFLTFLPSSDGGVSSTRCWVYAFLATFEPVEIETFASAATAVVAIAAFVLSIYNTVRARTPRPRWETEWKVGRGQRKILRDGIRFRLTNQGRGDAYDVTIEARPDSGTWARAGHLNKMAFGETRIVALTHEGLRAPVTVVWEGSARPELSDPSTIPPGVSIRITWRQAPHTHRLRSKEYRLGLASQLD